MKNKAIVTIVLCILFCSIVAAAWRLTQPVAGAGSLSGTHIEVTFLAYGIRPETAEEIAVGEPIYNETGRECFRITEVAMSPASQDTTDSAGVLHVVQHPTLKDIIITARSVDLKTSWCYIYGRDKILAGTGVAVYGDTWKVWTKILTVKNVS